MRLSTRLGLMGGFLSMLFITILYITNSNLLIIGYERFTLLIFLATMVYGVLQQRQTNLSPNKIEDLLGHQEMQKVYNNDFASFGELLKLGFKIYVIGFFIRFLFIYFLFNYYDTQLIEMYKEVNERIFIEFKNPKDTELIFQQKLNDYRAGNFAPSFKNFLGIAIELIIGFIMAFFIALLFNRNQPDY
ncbi:MAG: DUF4199 domain-containing protein [Saprospiraceae bacterium]|nr:DUF4199 domain-containing protein [Saprospiraceae bacterium]